MVLPPKKAWPEAGKEFSAGLWQWNGTEGVQELWGREHVCGQVQTGGWLQGDSRVIWLILQCFSHSRSSQQSAGKPFLGMSSPDPDPEMVARLLSWSPCESFLEIKTGFSCSLHGWAPSFQVSRVQIWPLWKCKTWRKSRREGIYVYVVFPGGSLVKNPPANAGDVGLIPGSERPPGEGNENQLQCSCLENPMDRGAWRAIVHGVAKSQTQLSD